MNLKINGKSYSFVFGVKFVRELDKRSPIRNQGIEFGMGLTAKILPELKAFNVNTLAHVLLYANGTEAEKITLDELDDFIDQTKDIEKLFDEVMKEISESNAGKLAARNVDKEMKKAQKKA
jgi:hypothetical protein